MTKSGRTKQKNPRTKLMERSHTGKLLPHKHTSYGSLILILIVVFFPLFMATHSVAQADATNLSGQGSYQTYAVVPGSAPKQAPTISNLTNGTVVTSTDPIVVKGVCSTGTLIKIFKNNVLAGSALCQNSAYQVSIDLFIGNNSIIARAYNNNDQVSPDSTVVSAQLNLPGSNLDGTEQLNTQGAPAGQFYVTSEQSHRGAEVGQVMSWPLTIAGGQPPYAVNVSWGDGKTDLFSRGNANQFTISHAYARPAGSKGSYTIVVTSSDQAGNHSYLQLVAIVSGDTSTGIVGTIGSGSSHSAILKTSWGLLGGSTIAVLSFWLGEKRQTRLLIHNRRFA